ncbi:MAG: hypothetical protein WCS85_03905 [Candidatus Peribacteraceae bacterium]
MLRTEGETEALIFTLLQPQSPEKMGKLNMDLARYILAVNRVKQIFSPHEVEYLRAFFTKLMIERNNRADEVDSANVHEAATKMKKLFRAIPYGRLCIDGRINLTVIFGIFAGVGGAVETPAGDTTDFKESSDSDELVLKEGSVTADQLDTTLQSTDEPTAQIWDCHIHCAAKDQECEEDGIEGPDHGLLEDVKRKKKCIAALNRYVRRKHPEKTVLNIPITFNPEDSFSFMGLETDQALEYAEQNEGFTTEALEELTAQNKIISSRAIAMDPVIQSAFQYWYSLFQPNPDWKHHYEETAYQFAFALEDLKKEFGPYIGAQVTEVFGELPEDELDERVTLLLASALNGYFSSIVRENDNAEHAEEFASVTQRDFRPCHTMGFGVNSEDRANMPGNVVFAQKIVRKVRKKGNAKVPRPFPSRKEYVRAPVPVVVKEICRGEICPEQWAIVENADWSFLYKENIDWMVMEDTAFLHLLSERFPSLSLTLGEALNNLRNKMRALYQGGRPSARRLKKGKLFALPVLSDQSRRFRCILPLFRKGLPLDREPAETQSVAHDADETVETDDPLDIIHARVIAKGTCGIRAIAPKVGSADISVTVEGDLSATITQILAEMRKEEGVENEELWRQRLAGIAVYALTAKSAIDTFRESDILLNSPAVVVARRIADVSDNLWSGVRHAWNRMRGNAETPTAPRRMQQDQYDSAWMATRGKFLEVLLHVLRQQLQSPTATQTDEVDRTTACVA